MKAKAIITAELHPGAILIHVDGSMHEQPGDGAAGPLKWFKLTNYIIF